jgi:RNA polymerase sigma-70 factor (ECF subfamily)
MNDLGIIWTEHAAAALRVCRAHVGPDAADDALGRVSLAAQSSIVRSPRDIDNPRAWLLSITRNVCCDIHRERLRGNVDTVDGDALERAAGRRAFALDHGNPERQYLARERMRRMKSALDTLPHELREPLCLIAEGEADYAALADALGVTPAALRKRMQRARALLRHILRTEEKSCLTRNR